MRTPSGPAREELAEVVDRSGKVKYPTPLARLAPLAELVQSADPVARQAGARCLRHVHAGTLADLMRYSAEPPVGKTEGKVRYLYASNEHSR